MKKFVVALLILFSFILCSCTANTSGYIYELTSSKWTANLDGGAELELEFDNDTAYLYIQNAEKYSKIEGKYIADETTFVIFVPEISTNYIFNYKPKGNTLDLSYNGNTITLNKVAY